MLFGNADPRDGRSILASWCPIVVVVRVAGGTLFGRVGVRESLVLRVGYSGTDFTDTSCGKCARKGSTSPSSVPRPSAGSRTCPMRNTCAELEEKYGITYDTIEYLLSDELPAALPEELLTTGQKNRIRREFHAAMSVADLNRRNRAAAEVVKNSKYREVPEKHQD
jgi:hypothetical protein